VYNSVELGYFDIRCVARYCQNTRERLPLEAQSTLTVNGGLVDVAGDLWMGQSPAEVSINLNGGTLTVGGNFRTSDALSLDISGGTLSLNGDQSAVISELVSSGQLTLAGNSALRGGLFISYDADADTTTVSANAAKTFSNDLKGYDGDNWTDPAILDGSGLESSALPGADWHWELIAFDATGATFGINGKDDNWRGRNTLRTVEEGYNTTSFTAAVTVDRTAANGVNIGSVFLGMGTAGKGWRRVPDREETDNASIIFELEEFALGGSPSAAWGTNVDAGYTEAGSAALSGAGTGLIQLKMEFDAVAQTAAFSIDYGADGTYEDIFAAYDVSAVLTEMAAGDRASIYFGTDNSATMSDFSVAAAPSLIDPNKAWNAIPSDVAVDVAPDTATLSWSAGDATAAAGGHVLYFGTDANAVENGSSGNTLDTAEAAVPEELMLGQTYYWRVDQIAEDATEIKGDVWSFTVSKSVLVDDFESYVVFDANTSIDDPNLIFNNWEDGIINDIGSEVFLEQVIVNRDVQAMKMVYDNNDVVPNSEVKRTFDSVQDWSKHGIKSLYLMFRGEASNTFDSVYVKINDTKMPYPLLASHLQFAQWKPWIINLKDVETDLTKVTSLAIGVDGAGSGTLYIDDIRLYGQEAQLMPAPDSGVAPDSNGLVAHYLFDGNAEDSSGNGHHGTLATGGTPNWVDGVFDGALDFSQMYGLDCGDFDPTGGTGKFTLTLWCYWEGGPIQQLVSKALDFVADEMMFQIELKGNNSWIVEQDRNRLNLAYAGAAQAGFDVVPTHGWVHLTLTFDGEQAIGYLNGIDSVGPKATGIGPNVAAPVILGATEMGDRILQGLMDDVRIYNYALTPAEVIGTIGVDLGFKPF